MNNVLRILGPALPCLVVLLWLLHFASAVNLVLGIWTRSHEPAQAPPPPFAARLDVDSLATRLDLPVPRPPHEERSYVIHQLGPSRYEVSRDVVRAFEVEFTCANSLLDVSPAYTAGVFRGFRLSFPRAPSYERLGLRDQDLLQRINGRRLDGSEHASTLITHLRAPPPRIELELERDGKRLRRTYLVK